MVAKSVGVGLAVMGLLAVGARWAGAAVTSAEDLGGTRHVNGRATLPAAGSPAAKNGPMYKFSKNEFSSLPGAGGLSAAETLAKVAAAKSADLQYLPERDGSLWAFSGQIAEVPGALYLADAAGKKLEEPWPITKTTTNLEGEARNIMEGAVYLVKTTEGKFALLRVLEKTPQALVIQYVYQGEGGTTFDIPKRPTVPYERPVEAQPQPGVVGPVGAGGVVGGGTGVGGVGGMGPVGAGGVVGGGGTGRPVVEVVPVGRGATSVPALGVPDTLGTRPALGPNDVVQPGVIRLLNPDRAPGLEPTLDTFAQQRMQMIQRRLDVINLLARTPDEVDKKTRAIADLASLHADESVVADLLVREITFFNTRAVKGDLTEGHPCFVALKQMGKSATAAALKGLAKMDVNAPGEGLERPQYRAQLLGKVVRSVEGDDGAEYIFKREAARATDPKEKAVWELVLGK